MPMRWVDVEAVVVDYVRQRFNALCQEDPAGYSRNFGAAYKQLQDLSRNPDYSLALIGDAYCLKYHLMRMDNLCVALDAVHRAYPLLQSRNAQVLDMGGGTGGTAMAVAYWASVNFDLQSSDISITSIEPSAPMRETAQHLVRSFLRRLVASDPVLTSSSIKHRIVDDNLEDCAGVCREKKGRFYDLIIFSYALWKQDRDEWDATASHILDVARMLKPNGVLMFLSPKSPPEKVMFMRHLTAELKNDGFVQLRVNIGKGASRAPVKHPQCLQDALREINKTCHKLTGKYPLGWLFGIHRDDRPYYGFYGTVEAFTLP
jgi:SAM-dependent methyltransferase